MHTPGLEIKARARLQEGELLNGRYRLGKKLGAGGFAIVYEAFDTLIERPVAIKLLTSLIHAQDDEDVAAMLERFRREARAAAQFKHPNVVTIFDMGVVAQLDQPFIVMERLEGHDLKAELRHSGPLQPRRALRLLGRVLEALAEGHRAGIIHRDLKPSNLFLIDPGQPQEDIRLLDFGIARIESAPSGHTSRDNLFGTANYLAPEYIRDRLVTPQLDIYQMGLILAEALTGAPVVSGEHAMNAMMTHMNGDLALPEALLSGPLGPVLTRALAFNPGDRYPDAGAFLAELQRLDPAALQAPRGAAASLNEISFGARSLALPPPEPATRPIPPEELEALALLEAPSPSPPPSPGHRLTLILSIAAIALVVGSLGAVALAWRSWPQLAAAPERAAPERAAPVEAPAPPAPPELTIAEPALITLSSTPPGATVLDGAAVLGVTPLEIVLEDGQQRRLGLSLKGYEDEALTLSHADPTPRHVALSPTARRPRPTPPLAPTQSTERATGRATERATERPTRPRAPPTTAPPAGGLIAD